MCPTFRPSLVGCHNGAVTVSPRADAALTTPDWPLVAARTEHWLRALVAHGSVTNSAGETSLAPWLQGELQSALGDRVEVRLLRTERDPYERYTLAALVRGSGRRTVVLTGHYDTVGLDNYGALAEVALDPDGLREALIEALEAVPEPSRSPADHLALADLRGGDFLPGRGALDMKGGLAPGLALLEAFAALDAPVGNLLFVTVPDEEESSSGMRSAARQLPELARGWDLELCAAINLDAEADPGDGAQGRAIFLGSVGKLLPSVLVVGRPTHAGAPWDGLSAASLAAELIRDIDGSPELADPGLNGVRGTVPVVLQAYDLKPHYDITTPEMVWCAFNLLTRTLGPDEVMRQFCEATRGAVGAALARAASRAERAGARLDAAAEPEVLSYADLLLRAYDRGGQAALEQLDALAQALANDPSLDTPRVCQRLAEATVRLADLHAPAAVVLYGSLYYPPALLGASARDLALRGAAERAAAATAAVCGESIRVRDFFTGVSDMSFLGADPGEAAHPTVAANTPAWPERYASQSEVFEPLPLRLPTVNAGPWGRDYHQRTERIHLPYVTRTLPRLLWHLLGEVLGPG